MDELKPLSPQGNCPRFLIMSITTSDWSIVVMLYYVQGHVVITRVLFTCMYQEGEGRGGVLICENFKYTNHKSKISII